MVYTYLSNMLFFIRVYKGFLGFLIFVCIKIHILLKIAFHPAYIHPVKEGHRFPMSKYELIPLQLLHEGLVGTASFFNPKLAEIAILKAAHDPAYIDQLLQLTLDPKMIRRIGFPLDQDLVDRERLLVQGTIDSCQYALSYGIAFNIAGGTHHAGYDYGEGFCLINDQGVAARYLLLQGLAKKVLIIDLDVHQGNGTADMFAQDAAVYTFSMHCEKNYPFVKAQSSLDVGLEIGISDAEYLQLLEEHIPRLLEQEKPDFVFYQAGVDILSTDKLGKLKLSLSGCKQRDTLVFKSCLDRGIPVQVSMGGGYSTDIKDIVNAHVQTFRTAIELYNF